MMDDGEDALGKISRQLSELSAVPQNPVATSGGEWTQFSGISTNPGSSSSSGEGLRHSLYTWNSHYQGKSQQHNNSASSAESKHSASIPNIDSSHRSFHCYDILQNERMSMQIRFLTSRLLVALSQF